jgi:hypothetical protein
MSREAVFGHLMSVDTEMKFTNISDSKSGRCQGSCDCSKDEEQQAQYPGIHGEYDPFSAFFEPYLYAISEISLPSLAIFSFHVSVRNTSRCSGLACVFVLLSPQFRIGLVKRTIKDFPEQGRGVPWLSHVETRHGNRLGESVVRPQQLSPSLDHREDRMLRNIRIGTQTKRHMGYLVISVEMSHCHHWTLLVTEPLQIAGMEMHKMKFKESTVKPHDPQFGSLQCQAGHSLLLEILRGHCYHPSTGEPNGRDTIGVPTSLSY